jgi:hypothetical protein
MSDELSDEELCEAARAAIKAGALPMPENFRCGGELQAPLMSVPNKAIRCAVCGRYMYERDQPYKLTAFLGQPEIHNPRCVNAWFSAARDEWGKAFDSEEFHLGDPWMGEGCLIWASVPPSTRVRFFLNRSILMGVLGCNSALAGDVALARCQEQRTLIEDACRRAFGERPSEAIELQAADFQ